MAHIDALQPTTGFHAPKPRRHRGLGLIEVVFAVLLVGLGAVAIVTFFTSATASNARLDDLYTGVVLATSAHEWANNQYFKSRPSATPPIVGIEDWPTATGITGPAIPAGLTAVGWTQAITASRVDEMDVLNAGTAKTCIRVTVTIKKNRETVYTASRLYTEGFR